MRTHPAPQMCLLGRGLEGWLGSSLSSQIHTRMKVSLKVGSGCWIFPLKLHPVSYSVSYSETFAQRTELVLSCSLSPAADHKIQVPVAAISKLRKASKKQATTRLQSQLCQVSAFGVFFLSDLLPPVMQLIACMQSSRIMLPKCSD